MNNRPHSANPAIQQIYTTINNLPTPSPNFPTTLMPHANSFSPDIPPQKTRKICANKVYRVTSTRYPLFSPSITRARFSPRAAFNLNHSQAARLISTKTLYTAPSNRYRGGEATTASTLMQGHNLRHLAGKMDSRHPFPPVSLPFSRERGV